MDWGRRTGTEGPAIELLYCPDAQQLVAYIEYVNQGATIDRIVRYAYYENGHVSNTTIWEEQTDTSKDLYLVYGTNEKLWLAIWQKWNVEDNPPEFEDIDVTDICEFRYDGGRQRYLARHWSMTIVGGYPVFSRGAELWTDYLGEQPYIDYEIEVIGGVGTPNEWTRYLAGAGVHAKQEMYPVEEPISFLHGDLIRSTVLMTDDAGAVEHSMAYTAFGQPVQDEGQGGWHIGERLPDYFTRYGYAGGWGYESGNWGNPSAGYPGPLALYGENADLPPVTLLHVGERWYQPGIGRFVQRDPIGLNGGINLYAYIGAAPIVGVDPTGLVAWYDAVIWATGGDKSWLDSPAKVKRVQKYLNFVALACASAASPLSLSVKFPLGFTGGTINYWY